MCMLDASNTFDKVNLLTIFKNIVRKGNVSHLFEFIDEHLRRAKHAHKMELIILQLAREPRGKPALSCCKRLCIFIHSNNTPGSLLGWTTLQIFYWMSGILTFVALPQVGVKHIGKI